MVHVMSEVKNPISDYADQYRLAAGRGQKRADIWSVIADLERNIAPLWTAQRLRADTAEAELNRKLDAAETKFKDAGGIAAQAISECMGYRTLLYRLKVFIEQRMHDDFPAEKAEFVKKIDAAINQKSEGESQ